MGHSALQVRLNLLIFTVLFVFSIMLYYFFIAYVGDGLDHLSFSEVSALSGEIIDVDCTEHVCFFLKGM